MTVARKQFNSTYSQPSFTDTEDVLMRIASNLSDLQHNFDSEKINLLKKYIFDYHSVLRAERKNQ